VKTDLNELADGRISFGEAQRFEFLDELCGSPMMPDRVHCEEIPKVPGFSLSTSRAELRPKGNGHAGDKKSGNCGQFYCTTCTPVNELSVLCGLVISKY
jgi:hypothetical protein